MTDNQNKRPVVNEGATYFRAKEAAAYLGVHYSTFYKWVKSGVIPAGRRQGRRYVIWLRKDLDAYVESLPPSENLPCIPGGRWQNA